MAQWARMNGDVVAELFAVADIGVGKFHTGFEATLVSVADTVSAGDIEGPPGTFTTPTGATAHEQWEADMRDSDITMMTRQVEDMITAYGTTGLPQPTIDKYNSKVALRATEPV